MKKSFYMTILTALILCFAVLCCAHAAVSQVLVLPEGTKVIEAEAFYGDTSIREVVLPEGVESIGERAFANSGVTKVNLPETVEYIAPDAFDGCDGVTVIVIPETPGEDFAIQANLEYDFVTKQYGDFTYTYIMGVTWDGDNYWDAYEYYESKITAYTGTDTQVVIPAVIDGYSVACIGEKAFCENTNLRNVVIPDTVRFIDGYAFYGCSNLESITLPNSLEYIWDYTFSGCSSLRSVTLPDSIRIIFAWAFSGCTNLTDINMPKELIEIDTHAFRDCIALTNIDMPSTLTSIGHGAFWGCSNLSSISISNNDADIANYAFYQCSSLKSISLPNNLTSINQGTFWGCSSLTNVIIPSGVTIIKDYAFQECSNLSSISIPQNVTQIGKYAFYQCESLIEVIIPKSVKSIGEYALARCTKLTRITLPESLTTIERSTFSGCESLLLIDIPDNVTSIGDSAFDSCSSLYSIDIPDSVTSIGSYAFFYCSALTNVNLPCNLKTIGECAFHSCGFSSIVIPNGVTSIPELTFYYCYNLVSITIPDSVTSIETNAFHYVPQLTIYGKTGSAVHAFAVNNRANFVDESLTPSLTDDYYELLHAYSINDSVYFEANLIKDYNGVKAGTTYEGRHFFLNSHGEVVTDPATLCKLFTISMYADFEDNQHRAMKEWKSVANTCVQTTQQFMQAQSLSKVLGEVTGGAIATYLKALMTGNALKLTEIVEVVLSVPSSETVVCVSAEMMYINLLLDHLSESVDYAVSFSAKNNAGAYDYDLVENALAWYRYNAAVYHAVQDWSMPVVNTILEDYSSSFEMTIDLYAEFWNSMCISGIDNLGMGLMNEVFKKWMMAETGAIKLLDSLLYIVTSDQVQWGISYFENSMIVLSQCFGIDLDDMSGLTKGFYMSLEEMKTTQLYKNHLLAQ